MHTLVIASGYPLRLHTEGARQKQNTHKQGGGGPRHTRAGTDSPRSPDPRDTSANDAPLLLHIFTRTIVLASWPPGIQSLVFLTIPCHFYTMDKQPDQKLPVLEEQTDAYIIEPAPAPIAPLASRPEVPEHFYRKNKRGLIEAIEKGTGRILAVQSSAEDLLKDKFERVVQIDTPQGPVWIEKGLNFDLVHRLEPYPYSKILADLVCEEIAVHAGSMRSASEKLNVPYSAILRWKRENEEFRNEIAIAEKERAGSFHDEILEEARKSRDQKTKIATLQWAAEKGDSEKYGAKTKISGDKNAPLTIVLDTGIRRPGDPGYVEPTPQENLESLPATEPDREAPEIIDVSIKGDSSSASSNDIN